MPGPNGEHLKDRTIGRRKEDRLLIDQLHRYRQLFHVGQIITSEINMKILFEVIVEQSNQILGTQRSTVFLYDEKPDQLWSLVATGMKKNEIRIPADYGVAGWVFHHKSPLIINDAYNDPRFYSEIDKKSGFRTKNILCIPLINREGQCIGALQALNKLSGDFTDDDTEVSTAISYYVAIALENSRLYEELKLLDKAKERVVNHLSHELRTPLALISGVLGMFSRGLKESDFPKLQRTVNRGQRNLKRLTELQVKIDDILNQKSIEEKDKIINIITDAANFVDEFREERCLDKEQFLEFVSIRIESLFTVEEVHMEEIQVDELLHDVCSEAMSSMDQRDLKISRDIEKDVVLTMDRGILKKIFGGLLRNAIENTPDEGKIEITAKIRKNEIAVECRDWGVGVAPDNQSMIFGGFFHTQDTMFYTSKIPYEFNAGGTGCDLLRTRVFSERYGFHVDFDSIRCKFLPTDKNMCPGRISGCQFVTDKSECFSSGGSIFSVRFPNGRDFVPSQQADTMRVFATDV